MWVATWWDVFEYIKLYVPRMVPTLSAGCAKDASTEIIRRLCYLRCASFFFLPNGPNLFSLWLLAQRSYVRCGGSLFCLLYCFRCMFPLREKRSLLPRRGGLIRHLCRPLIYACYFLISSQIDRGSAYCFGSVSLTVCLLFNLTSSFTRVLLFFLRLASGEKSILVSLRLST